MSGGSYDYIGFKIRQFADSLRDSSSTKHRQEFQEILNDLAKAAHDIEWADSADYSQEMADHALNKFFGKWGKVAQNYNEFKL
jgi:hypothetical protein